MDFTSGQDVACYFITKHSWKGKYKRIFSVGEYGITTYNPGSMENTNQWMYDEFISIVPNVKVANNNEFIITMKKGKGKDKTDTMRFSTDNRADLLTEALIFRHKFSEPSTNIRRFNGYKYHWSENRLPVILQATECSLDQIELSTGKKLCSYYYRDMEGVARVSDYPGGVTIVHGGFGRLHLFALQERDELMKTVAEYAAAFVGVHVKQKKDPITMNDFVANRMGTYSTDEALTSYAEFTVQKLTPRSADPVRRVLCLSEVCLIERDPATYNVVTCKPLSEIFTLVRDTANPQKFSVEYVKGTIRTYTSTERDSLVASILDGVRASGNRDVCVRMTFTNRGYRFGPFTVPVSEEVESQHMKFIITPPAHMTFAEAVSRFNSNVSYSGLLHAVTAEGLFAENKERLINGTLSALLEREGDQNTISAEELEAQLHALRRLVASKAGFTAFTKLPKMRETVGRKVVKALERKNDAITHAGIDMLNALLVPMHDNYDLKQEQLNKYSLLSSQSFLACLLEVFQDHVQHGTGALVISALLDFLTFSLCTPYSETTDSAYFDRLLTMVAERGRVMYKLFQHPSMAIVKGAGMVMKAIIEEADPETAAKMQELALAEGALPKHLLIACFTQSSDSRMLTNRQLSRHLVGLWVTGHPTAMNLLKRIVPVGLLTFLDSTDTVPKEVDRMHVRDNLKIVQHQLQQNYARNAQWKVVEKQLENFLLHWRARIGLEKKDRDDRPIVLRKRRQRIKLEANWPLFYYYFDRDHARPNLIWNHKTREELRDALESEIRAFTVDKDLSQNTVIAWNHSEFEVHYTCLADEIKIGDYFLRLLLEEDDDDETSETSTIKRSYEFFNDLYHRFLLTPKISMKCLCLQAMTIVYGRCYEDIGYFSDTRYIVAMLERCVDKMERDRLLLFLNKLILNRRNERDFIDAKGITVLVDLITLAHLHITRATVPLQTNLIESGDIKRESCKEWYYSTAEKERLGPVSFDELKDMYVQGNINSKTRCWAPGMDGWRPLVQVPQLKWSLVATGQPVMNETDLATLVLNMLIRICENYPSRDSEGAIIRPLPRAKRLLSEATCLPHVVQLLLTFDPVLVEKVSTLLYHMMLDNPSLSRLYISGVFFFILMYTGSNVLPIARFLGMAHLRQAFRTEEAKSLDVLQRSILTSILPEAMVCYLENYTSEKFAEIFLGEFDTPEAIWNSEMRRMMIERIAAHLADYTPRMQSNTRALYQYCPIPVINYPQLENELFCNIYYLKHLCDTVRFPDWPIKEPVELLKDILEAWTAEVEKKPPSMSNEEAYEILRLQPKPDGGQYDEAKIRKAYFRMAQKYHPDKNPEGREIFEKVNKAYEFLCSRSKISDGPDPHNLLLIIKAQSILFDRYCSVLEPYKYAGYPMLVKTIQLETQDDQLFSKAAPLLAAAAELAYFTVKCSALNAEEMRRENGIAILQDAFARCVNVLGTSSKEDDLAVQVCVHISKFFGVASQFEQCREVIQENRAIIRDVCRILYYKNLPRLNLVVTETVSAFAVDFLLQTSMYQMGVLYHLLLFLFQYDFTLEEGGVDRSDESNQQEIANKLAKVAIHACARLAGANVADSVDKTPDNPAVFNSLKAMLTPYLAKRLGQASNHEVLKLLNSNSENPYLIWDNATRQELNEYLTNEQQSVVRTGECEPSFGAEFKYSLFEKELIVGEIFVRIYNEQPTYALENARSFTMDLLDFIGRQAQYMHSLMSLQNGVGPSASAKGKQLRLKQVEMALQALRNVIHNNPGCEIQTMGHFKLLFALLRLTDSGDVPQCTLEVLNTVTGNQECVNDIAASEVLSYLLLTLDSLPNSTMLVLETLHPMMSNTKLVKEAVSKGAMLYLLDLFCNHSFPQIRQQTAVLFARMLADKLVGPKIRIILTKFLPAIFADAVRDSPDAAVNTFEGSHENPELIWNDDSRETVCELVKELKASFIKQQRENPDVRWTIPEKLATENINAQGELVIEGVYVRLFIANPGWVLRNPRQFLTGLLEHWQHLVNSSCPDGDKLETLTSAIVGFLQSNNGMLEQLPSLGYVPAICQSMGSKNELIPRSGVLITNQMATNEICIRSMAQTSCVAPMKSAMEVRPDIVPISAETLYRLFSKADDDITQQALDCDMIPFLLQLLENRLDSKIENVSATKAQIVEALKSLQTNLKYGAQISELLEKSTIWRDYRDQKHGLFIRGPGAVSAITGPGVAGYLTAGTSNQPTQAPPMEKKMHY